MGQKTRVRIGLETEIATAIEIEIRIEKIKTIRSTGTNLAHGTEIGTATRRKKRRKNVRPREERKMKRQPSARKTTRKRKRMTQTIPMRMKKMTRTPTTKRRSPRKSIKKMAKISTSWRISSSGK